MGDRVINGFRVPEVSSLPTAGRRGRLRVLTGDSILYYDSGAAWIKLGITIDQTIIDASTNPVAGNAVFDALALKLNAARPIVDKTASYPISASESGTIFTNAGATVYFSFVLPSTGLAAGQTTFGFFGQVAGVELTILPGGNYIYIAGLETDDGIVNGGSAATLYGYLELLYIGGGKWLTTENVGGAWTVI